MFQGAIKNLFNTREDENGFFYEYTGTEGEKEKPSSTDIVYFNGDGDRISESIELLKQSDIIITNPPFSLFRNAQLVKTR